MTRQTQGNKKSEQYKTTRKRLSSLEPSPENSLLYDKAGFFGRQEQTPGSSTGGEAAGQSPLFLKAGECAARYGVSHSTWRRMVDAGQAPQPTRFRGCVNWKLAELDAWDAEGNPKVRTVKGGRK